MHKSAFLLLTGMLGLALTGCAGMIEDRASEPAAGEQTPVSTVKTAEPGELPESGAGYGEFEPETLYLLLAAEIAAQRGRYDVTLVNYVEAAMQSRDSGVIERAMRIAQSLNADNAQRQLSELWLETDPDNLEAHRVAAIQQIKKNNLEAALQHMETILDLGGDADFDSLAAMAANLPPDDQQELLGLYQALEDRHPENLEIQYSIALLLKVTGKPGKALEQLNPLLAEHPDFQPGLVLKGDLLYETGEKQEALRHLLQNTRRYPDNRQMGTLYARMLIGEGEFQAAQDEFARLIERFPEVPGLKLSHALVALENGETGVAREDLTRLIEQGHHVNAAHYYLGRIAQEAGNIENAIEYYQKVEEGRHFLPALERLSALRVETGRVDEAREAVAELRKRNPDRAETFWLIEINLLLDADRREEALAAANEALESYPDNIRILYARAMLLDSLGQLDAAERDLRRIIKLQPDNAVALNALGYILTTRTDRLEEARDLIERALRIDPDNPAILDSMGWVLFQQGETDRAIDYLRRAYEAFPDPEVAAHLGEALWVDGQQEQARIIWRRAMEENPEDELIPETIERLQVEMTQ
ncbi:tetratricopeptide repeat protein [Marinobacter sp.]|uniref:tetratricopeptide repeat protein n=1 Tax=Marinobacter sp. TaxID=50741 RepID=UPI00384EF9DF